MVLQVLHLILDGDKLTAQTADGYSAGILQETVEGIKEKTSISLPLGFEGHLQFQILLMHFLKTGKISQGGLETFTQETLHIAFTMQLGIPATITER